MSNSRKEAFRRMQQIKTQKIGNTTITTPQPVRGRRVKQDEIYAEMVDRFWEEVEQKSIDLSRWNGEGSPWLYRELVD
jgi:23S rRNA maturation-related 3'-5' exoribonuclease YhaM